MDSLQDKNFVLLVDDNEMDAEMTHIGLAEIEPNLEVEYCHDGLEALAFLRVMRKRNRVPSLLILDLNMPYLDGLQVLKIIQQEGLKQFPIAVFTGLGLLNDTIKERLEELGADKVFEKPFDFEESKEMYREMLLSHNLLSNKVLQVA